MLTDKMEYVFMGCFVMICCSKQCIEALRTLWRKGVTSRYVFCARTTVLTVCYVLF